MPLQAGELFNYVTALPCEIDPDQGGLSPGPVKPVSVKLFRRLFASAPFVCASGLLQVDFTVADSTTYRLGPCANSGQLSLLSSARSEMSSS